MSEYQFQKPSTGLPSMAETDAGGGQGSDPNAPTYLGAPCDVEEIRGRAARVLEFMEASKPRTYVRDVCVTCGRTIERVKP